MDNSGNALASNINKYYLFNFLKTFYLGWPIYMIFLMANSITLTQIMIIEAAFWLGIVVFEIPSGFLADRYGRKNILICASLLWVAGSIIYAFSSDFIFFFIAILLSGIGAAFNSGADSAFLYDSLLKLKREKEYNRIEGKAKFIYYSSRAVASLLGAYVFLIGIRLPFQIMIAVNVLILLTVLTFREPPFKHSSGPHWQQVKETFGYVLKHKALLQALLLFMVVVSFSDIFFKFTQPYMSIAGLGVAFFGIMYFAFNIGSAFGSLSAHRMEKLIGESATINLFSWARAIVAVLMAMFIGIWSIFLFFLTFFLSGIMRPVKLNYINKRVPSSIRASVLSIRAESGGILFIIAMPLMGFVAETQGISIVFYAIAAVLFAAFILFNTAFKDWKKQAG